jgi:hypothetical protein
MNDELQLLLASWDHRINGECPECCKPDPYEQDREDNAVGTPGPLEKN